MEAGLFTLALTSFFQFKLYHYYNKMRIIESFTIWIHHSWIRLLLKTIFLSPLYHHLKQ